MKILLLLNLIIPFVMILVGYQLKRKPVTDMTKGNGYSTPVSRKSIENWNYAQKIAPDIFIFFGKVLLVIEIVLSAIMAVLDFGIIGVSIGNIIGFGVMIAAFIYTDKKIEQIIQ